MVTRQRKPADIIDAAAGIFRKTGLWPNDKCEPQPDKIRCNSSISASGADLATGSSLTITGPSQVKRPDHRPITAQPSAALDTKLDYLAAHSRMVDQLYEIGRRAAEKQVKLEHLF